MAGPVDVLRELHRLRRHAGDLREQIERGPKMIQAHQARLARQEEQLRQTQDALKQLRVATHEKEVRLKGTYQQIDKYERQVNEISSKKEYDALRAEIAVARGSCQRLEDEILEGMSQTEEQTARLPELEKALHRAREEYAEFERATRQRLARQAEELTQVEQKIKEVEAELPEDLRPLYERLVHARGAEAMSAVRERTCSACYTAITAQQYNDLLSGRLVLCKACGRILYLPE